MQKILTWLDDRTGYRVFLRSTLYEPIPGGARWQYVWGTTLVFTFMLQMLTGMCLWMTYSPSATTAWESVFYIQNVMTLGWVVRGIHHFAAQTMMILLALHLMQVVIQGSYQAPREINFWLGLVLMQIVMVLGVTGYLLPWDQRGYAATQIVTGIIGSTPIVGPAMQEIVQGGSSNGNLNITRFFALHAGILPACLIGLLLLHGYVFRRHGFRGESNSDHENEYYWPDQFLRDGVACLTVLLTILGCVWYWHGGELTAPANPAEAYSAARPEWYYLFLFKFLSLPWVAWVGAETGLGESFGAVVVPGMIMTVIFLMPFIARLRYGKQFNIAYMWVVMGIAGVLTGMALYSDWIADTPEGRNFRLAVKDAHLEARRANDLALSPSGIPPDGAANLLKNDPLTQGPKLFQVYCISCHQPKEGWNFKELPVAPALADPHHREESEFASREWIRSVLTDYSNHFAALANTTGEQEEAAQNILNGSMKDWSESNGPILLEPENKGDLDALVEFLYAQSQRPDAPPPENEAVLRGKAIFTDGKLKSGSIDACVDCHAMRPLTVVDGEFVLAEEALSEDLFPDLTGYGSTKWLMDFIGDPQAHYAGEGGNNAMPAFKDQLRPHELELLSKWLARDYYLPQGKDLAEH